MIQLVTAAEMRSLDEEAIRGLGIPGVVLMESAGRGVVEVIAGLGPVAGRPIAVVCGPGNNGGDGYVITRHLHNRGARVVALRCVAVEQVKGDARVHHDAARGCGVRFVDGTAAGWAEAAGEIDRAEIVVDALLGTGVTRAVEGHLAEVIARVNAAPGVKVAVDLPSGMDASLGRALGACVAAQHTVTFAWPKLGMVGWPGFLQVGRLHVVDIGIPPRLAARLTPPAWLLDEGCLEEVRRPRPRDGHKGTFGHVLVVGGSPGHKGAALMAAEAAGRAGAGLVTVATGEETRRALDAMVVEVMTASLGPEPLAEAEAWPRLAALLDGKKAIAFGPGIERSPAVKGLLASLLGRWTGPLVIDADGLNLLAEDPALLRGTPATVILTPHPAEMGRLMGLSTVEVQADRCAAARRLAAETGAIVALKGARTVVASPDGRLAINPTGNPGMASGGSGDVLTGVAAALAATGMEPFAATAAAVYLHGLAGDRAAAAQGETGLLAGDVIAALPLALRG